MQDNLIILYKYCGRTEPEWRLSLRNKAVWLFWNPDVVVMSPNILKLKYITATLQN